MLFAKKKPLNDVDLSMCNPIIVNQTDHSVVLFLDRGVLYNKQVLAPGEAVGMTRKETAGTKIMPYKIHAVVGDEKSLPTRRHSIKNLASTAVIPTAFIVGTFMAASSAGTLAGPSKALSRVAGGIAVRGLVIDSAALAAGSLAASRAEAIAEKLLEQKPGNFSAKSGRLMPGNRCVVIKGGIDTPLTITTVKEKVFRQIEITGMVKTPMDTLQEKVEYLLPAILKSSKTEDVEDEPEEENEIKALTECTGATNNADEALEALEITPKESKKELKVRLKKEEEERKKQLEEIAPKESKKELKARLKKEAEEQKILEEELKRQEEEMKNKTPAVLF